jgi:hypothetical protein
VGIVKKTALQKRTICAARHAGFVVDIEGLDGHCLSPALAWCQSPTLSPQSPEAQTRGPSSPNPQKAQTREARGPFHPGPPAVRLASGPRFAREMCEMMRSGLGRRLRHESLRNSATFCNSPRFQWTLVRSRFDHFLQARNRQYLRLMPSFGPGPTRTTS